MPSSTTTAPANSAPASSNNNNSDNKKPARPPTAFEARVYEATSAIPRGRVSTYGEVAKLLGSSPRAVGGALRRNPFAPRVPCHRVVAAGGAALGGFSGTWGATPETARKLAMLVEEEVEMKKKKTAKRGREAAVGGDGGGGVEFGRVMTAAELAEALRTVRASSSSSAEAKETGGPSGGGLSKEAASPEAEPARGGCLGCLSAAVLPLLSSHGGEGRPAEDHPYEEEGPPLLRVRIAYHAFSDEEIELAGGKGREREGSESATHAPAASPIPASLSPSSRAADVLGSGILFVRPRRAWNLRAAPLWRLVFN